MADERRNPFSPDELLSLGLVAGLSARHLPLLAAVQGSLSSPFEGEGAGEGAGLVRRAREALRSRAAVDRALAIRAACERAGIRILFFGSADYPPLLGAVADAPLVLFSAGRGEVGSCTAAIVGSRAPTEAGRRFARELSRDLAHAGVDIVSGMARGIDAAAHEGALLGGGATFAVLGCGVDVVYPPEAVRLRNMIMERGALLSEFPPGTPPRPLHFPRRNRIISGLSRAVVVAEAAQRSGALITARLALDQGREVLAVPGNPLFPHTAGSNGLLKEGAAPVTAAEDVLCALGLCEPGRPPAGSRQERILRCLSREKSADEIARECAIAPAELFPLLLEMELRKLLERNAGGYYKRLTDLPDCPED